MRTSSKLVLAVAALLLAAGGFLFLRSRLDTPPTPDEQIVAALHDAQVAAQSRDLNGVMDLVADDFQSGDWNKPRLRLALSRLLQNGRGEHYDVHINAPQIYPSTKGDPKERVVVSQASVFWADTGEDIWGTNPVTLVMREETRRRWLFFTEPRWRIVSVSELNLPGADGYGI